MTNQDIYNVVGRKFCKNCSEAKHPEHCPNNVVCQYKKTYFEMKAKLEGFSRVVFHSDRVVFEKDGEIMLEVK